MLENISIQFIQGFLIGGGIGFVIGFGSSLYLGKENLTTEKRVSILLLILWTVFQVWGFFKGTEVPMIFNIIAGGGVGNLYGMSFSSAIAEIFKGIGKK